LKRSAEREGLYMQLFNRVRIGLVRLDVVMRVWPPTNNRDPQANGGLRPSFTASLIECRDKYRLSEKEMAYLSGLM
jgi:hypothetical protein